jgi:hypothetical protein
MLNQWSSISIERSCIRGYISIDQEIGNRSIACRIAQQYIVINVRLYNPLFEIHWPANRPFIIELQASFCVLTPDIVEALWWLATLRGQRGRVDFSRAINRAIACRGVVVEGIYAVVILDFRNNVVGNRPVSIITILFEEQPNQHLTQTNATNRVLTRYVRRMQRSSPPRFIQ